MNKKEFAELLQNFKDFPWSITEDIYNYRAVYKDYEIRSMKEMKMFEIIYKNALTTVMAGSCVSFEKCVEVFKNNLQDKIHQINNEINNMKQCSVDLKLISSSI